MNEREREVEGEKEGGTKGGNGGREGDSGYVPSLPSLSRGEHSNGE